MKLNNTKCTLSLVKIKKHVFVLIPIKGISQQKWWTLFHEEDINWNWIFRIRESWQHFKNMFMTLIKSLVSLMMQINILRSTVNVKNGVPVCQTPRTNKHDIIIFYVPRPFVKTLIFILDVKKVVECLNRIVINYKVTFSWDFLFHNINHRVSDNQRDL